MAEPDESPRLFAGWAEAPLAYACAVLALTTLVWKTMGLSFVPGWDEMFGGVGAQYPRRVEDMAPAWRIGYLLMYGVLGSAATISGLLVTRRRGGLSSPVGPRICRYARVHGAFHTVIGLHHTLWAVSAGAWGHLALEQFGLPGLYVAGGIGGFATGLHGLRLLLCTPEALTAGIVRSKIAVDGVSFLTFVSVLVCFPINALGLERNLDLERISWAAVFLAPLAWLGADLLAARTRRTQGRSRRPAKPAR